MVKNAPNAARRAATLLLPLSLLATPAFAQTAVKEDSVILQPDKVADDAPVIAAQVTLPSWTEENATALLSTIENIGAEGLFAKDYNPDELAAAILSNDQAALDKRATDTFLLDLAAFGMTGPLAFINSLATGLPASGVDMVVLQDSDNDGNPATAFNAIAAANLIAGALTGDGPGFFVYFNSVLSINRLVFSTNLNSTTSDLAILAAIQTPTGADAIAALPRFTAPNFQAVAPVPLPAALPLLAAACQPGERPVYLTFDTGHMEVAPLVADVLQRPAFADRLAARATDPASLLARWQASARLAPRVFAAPWGCTDPLDQKFLDLASTARAGVLVTKDKALLKVGRRAQRQGLTIVDVAGAIEMLALPD